jgi:hypothetical protein
VELVSGAAGAIVGAAAKTLVTGTDFGDNLLQALPSVIGQTIGNAIAGEIQDQMLLARMSQLPGGGSQSDQALRVGAALLNQADAIAGRQPGTTYNIALNDQNSAAALWNQANLTLNPGGYSLEDTFNITNAYLQLAGVNLQTNSIATTPGDTDAEQMAETKVTIPAWVKSGYYYTPIPGGSTGETTKAQMSTVPLPPAELSALYAYSFDSTAQAALTLGLVTNTYNQFLLANNLPQISTEWTAALIMNNASQKVQIINLMQSDSSSASHVSFTLPSGDASSDYTVVGMWHLHPPQPSYTSFGFSVVDYRSAVTDQQLNIYGPNFQSFVTVANNEEGQPLWATYVLPKNLPSLESVEDSAITDPATPSGAPTNNVDNLTLPAGASPQAYLFPTVDVNDKHLSIYIIPGTLVTSSNPVWMPPRGK